MVERFGLDWRMEWIEDGFRLDWRMLERLDWRMVERLDCIRGWMRDWIG